MDFSLLHTDKIAEIIDKNTQLLHFFRIRRIMRPIKKGYGLPVKILCHRFICQQHEVLYDLCSCIALIGTNLQRASFFIQKNFTLREIKVNSPSFPAPFSHNSRKLFHPFKKRHKLCMFLLKPFHFSSQNSVHRSIAHPPVYADYCFADSVVCHIPLAVYLHDTA